MLNACMQTVYNYTSSLNKYDAISKNNGKLYVCPTAVATYKPINVNMAVAKTTESTMLHINVWYVLYMWIVYHSCCVK